MGLVAELRESCCACTAYYTMGDTFAPWDLLSELRVSHALGPVNRCGPAARGGGKNCSVQYVITYLV
jgi:hypothetical protein